MLFRMWAILVCSMIVKCIMVSGSATLEMSQGVVYKEGGNITLFCKYVVEDIPPDIDFIWHKDANPTPIAMKKTYKQHDGEYLSQHIIPNAGIKDNATYSCEIKGKPRLTQESTVTIVNVNDDPAVQQVGSRLDVGLLDQELKRDIRCYSLEYPFPEMEDCMELWTVTEESVGNHGYAIASTRALQNYKNISAAIEMQVTFNMTKPFIGLKTEWHKTKVTFTLLGESEKLADMVLFCGRKRANTSGYAVKDMMFSCSINSTTKAVDIQVLWTGKLVFDNTIQTPIVSGTVRNGISAAKVISGSILVFVFGRLMF